MENRYKIILSGSHLYKEVELSEEMHHLKVGTGLECDVRLRKELFFGPICVAFTQNKDGWIVEVSEGFYLSMGDIRKLYSKPLEHGDQLDIKYAKTNSLALRLEFCIDFDNGNILYDRIVEVDGCQMLRIGSDPQSQLVLHSQLAMNEDIWLQRKGQAFEVVIKETKYGVNINGKKAENHSLINSGDFFSIADSFFYYKDKCIYTQVKKEISVNSLNFVDRENDVSYPKFNRNTRMKTLINKEDIEVLDPPSKPSKPEGNIILQLLPAFLMLAVVVLVRFFMSGSGGAFILFSVCSMSVGILTSIISMVNQRKKYKKQLEEREEKYRGYIENKRCSIAEYRADEVKRLKDIYIDSKREIQNVMEFSGDLYDKTSVDEDFLHARVGTGMKAAERKINFKKKETFDTDDELTSLPEKVCDDFKNVYDAPIFLNCKEDGVIGVVGPKYSQYEFLKTLAVDLATRHYHKEVKFFFLIDDEDQDKYGRWTRWLPHVYSDDTDYRNIVYNDESKTQLFEYLYVELTERANKKGKGDIIPHYIIFVLAEWGIKTHPVSQYIEKAKDLGVTFIFFERDRYDLPMGCKEIVFLSDDIDKGYVVSSDEKDVKNYFTFEHIDDEILSAMALKLAPVYCEEISLENALTKQITLFELLDIIDADDLKLEARWTKSNVYDTLAAPLGVKTKDEVVALDIHEKGHGPHGLVAGTTGSGKSELLQSYILSMATLYHPYEVGFVVIDFKGGGMVNQFKSLPHLLGAITNIDNHEIARSLASIKAELEKRQRAFAEYGVNNIDAYISKYKSGETPVPIPHLVIIVDEFAELKAEQPEFMKELISAARIGRSLGIHLILATQKPAGQVNEQIWSNSRFKICLKVQSREDSSEVLKSPLASEIREPGRAYIQVGNNEVFELFQSAYSGAPSGYSDENTTNEFEISQVSLSGKRKMLLQRKNVSGDQGETTQLDAIVKHIDTFCQSKKIAKLPDICLPPLKDVITYPDKKWEKAHVLTIPIGIYDDPANQVQKVVYLDASSGNVVVIGASQYGKTNLLQLMLRHIGENYSPREVNVYLLDFGTMVLKVFDSLNHVGGVVTASEDEAVKNFFKMMNEEVIHRKELFASLGITSYSSYKEAGYFDLPQIIIAVDNLMGFKEYYQEYDEAFFTLCREGVSLGITVVATSAQTNGIGYRYMSNFANKICLYCNSKDEYNSLFDHCRMVIPSVAGRGLINLFNHVYEFQSYLAFEGVREIDRVRSIKGFIERINEKNGKLAAKRIPSIPKILDQAYVDNNCVIEREYTLAVGIDYATVGFSFLNLDNAVSVAVVGKESRARINFINLIMHHCMKYIFDEEVKAYIVDGYERKLEGYDKYGFVHRYTTDINEVGVIFDEMAAELQRRMEKVSAGGLDSIKDEPLLMCIIENANIFDQELSQPSVVANYKKMISSYKDLKVLFIFANVPNINIGYSSSDMLKQVKEANIFYIFEDLPAVKCIDINLIAMREYKKPIEASDGYLVTNDGSISKLRVVLSEEREE